MSGPAAAAGDQLDVWECAALLLLIAPGLTPEAALDTRVTTFANLVDARCRLMARLANQAAPAAAADAAAGPAGGSGFTRRADGTAAYAFRGQSGLADLYRHLLGPGRAGKKRA